MGGKKDSHVKVYRRVLRFVDSFLAKKDQKMLTTNGRSLLTYAELRQHIHGALQLTRKARRGR